VARNGIAGKLARMAGMVESGLRLRIDLFVRLFALLPRICLLVVAASFALYTIGRLLSTPLHAISSAQIPERLHQALLRVLGRLLDALLKPAGVDAASLAALIIVLILLVALFNWRSALGYAAATYVGSLVLGIAAALASSLTGLGGAVAGAQPQLLGGGLGDLFLYGLRELLTFSGLILDAVLGWMRGQVADLALLAAAMSALGFAAMYIDKQAAIVERLPELAGKPSLTGLEKEVVERAMKGGLNIQRIPERQLGRYALLGGGLGVLAGALLFRHKTRHLGLLAWVAVLTVTSLHLLVVASCA